MSKKPNIVQTCTTQIGGQKFCLTTGELAKQAGGSVLVQYGETVVLGTANIKKPMSPDADWMPLLVDYEEKFYAAGKIKGSRYIKREGRPTEEATLNARLIDRSIRPLFPENMINDVQIVLTVLSYDGENNPDIPAVLAASAALMISDVPWEGPLAGVRIGQVDGKLVVNPTVQEMEVSTLDLLIVGTGDRTTMIEAGAHEVSEETILDALEEASNALAKMTPTLAKLKKKSGKEAIEPVLMKTPSPDLVTRIKELAKETLVDGLKKGKDKATSYVILESNQTINNVKEKILETFD